MNPGILPGDRPWRCPRCECARGYVTVETSLSSSIKYEVVICEQCAHVEHRATDLPSIAALAERGLRGIRLVEFPAERQPDLEAPPVAPEPATDSPPDTAIVAAIHPDSSPPLPPNVSESPDPPAASSPAKVDREKANPADEGSGRMLTFLLIVSGLGAAAWLLFGRSSDPETRSPAPVIVTPAPPSDPLAGIAGAPHAVDPAAFVEQARLMTGIGSAAILTQIDAAFVGSNGRVDLDNPHYKGQIFYRFEGRVEAPPASPLPEGVPLGAPGNAPPLVTYFSQAVVLNVHGFALSEDHSWKSGSARHAPKEISPHCSFQQIWQAARTGDAPADAVATVKYTIKQDSPGWWFQIENTSFGFSFNPVTCTRY
jgi:hypothetical protein